MPSILPLYQYHTYLYLLFLSVGVGGAKTPRSPPPFRQSDFSHLTTMTPGHHCYIRLLYIRTRLYSSSIIIPGTGYSTTHGSIAYASYINSTQQQDEIARHTETWKNRETEKKNETARERRSRRKTNNPTHGQTDSRGFNSRAIRRPRAGSQGDDGRASAAQQQQRSQERGSATIVPVEKSRLKLLLLLMLALLLCCYWAPQTHMVDRYLPNEKKNGERNISIPGVLSVDRTRTHETHRR